MNRVSAHELGRPHRLSSGISTPATGPHNLEGERVSFGHGRIMRQRRLGRHGETRLPYSNWPTTRKRGRLLPQRNRNSVPPCRGVDPALQQKCIQRSLVSDPTQPRPAIGRGFLLAPQPMPRWLNSLASCVSAALQRTRQPNGEHLSGVFFSVLAEAAMEGRLPRGFGVSSPDRPTDALVRKSGEGLNFSFQSERSRRPRSSSLEPNSKPRLGRGEWFVTRWRQRRGLRCRAMSLFCRWWRISRDARPAGLLREPLARAGRRASSGRS